jgi:hypothetical protein
MNIVEQIFNAISTTTQTVAGVDYKYLRNVFNPGLNDLRSVSKGYGVIHGSASDADGILRHYTFDHQFEVILTRGFAKRMEDADIQTAINELYSIADDLLVEVFLKKLNLTTIVKIVNRPSIGTPEVLDNQAVLLRVGFNVKYHNEIT